MKCVFRQHVVCIGHISATRIIINIIAEINLRLNRSIKYLFTSIRSIEHFCLSLQSRSQLDFFLVHFHLPFVSWCRQ